MTFLRTLLINLTIIVLCWGEEPSCRIWSERRSVIRVGEYLYCQCRVSGVRSKSIEISRFFPYRQMPNKIIVDNTTVKTEIVESYEATNIFSCDWQWSLVLLYKAKITVIPLLNVKNFECRSYPYDNTGNCSFLRVGLWRFNEKSYFLSANGFPRVQCMESSIKETIVECTNIPIYQKKLSHIFKIEMEYVGDVQSQEILLNIQQIVSPSFSMLQIENITLENCKCLYIGFWKTPLDMIFCHWSLIPASSKVVRFDRNFSTNLNTLEFRDCPQVSIPAYQTVAFQVSCRVNVLGSPWSKKYFRNCRTMEDLPGRPPEVVPNGFSHDPNRNSLYVFWTHLDELEWNGPDFTYTVANGHGKKALRIGNTSAVFDDWDASVSTTVYIWSENSRGPSLNKSQIKVPILRNANQLKPKNLYYRKENHILFWNPPNDKKNLDGYTVYWCSATTNILQICDESEVMQIRSLDSSQLQFQFPKSMIFSNMAVAARYTDKIGGGMQWTGYKWTSNNYKASDPSGAGISYYIAPIGVSILIGLIIYLYRKYKKCSNIKVIVPEFLERHMIVNTPAPAVFPGNLSPEFVMDVSQLMPPKKAQIEQEYKDDDEPKNDAQNNFTATGSYSAIFKKPFENDPLIATGSYCMTHL